MRPVMRGAMSVVALMLVGCAKQPQPQAALPAPTATVTANTTAAPPKPTEAQTVRVAGSATFALTGEMNQMRWQNTPTLLGDGKALVAGGTAGKIKEVADCCPAAELGTYVPGS